MAGIDIEVSKDFNKDIAELLAGNRNIIDKMFKEIITIESKGKGKNKIKVKGREYTKLTFTDAGLRNFLSNYQRKVGKNMDSEDIREICINTTYAFIDKAYNGELEAATDYREDLIKNIKYECNKANRECNYFRDNRFVNEKIIAPNHKTDYNMDGSEIEVSNFDISQYQLWKKSGNIKHTYNWDLMLTINEDYLFKNSPGQQQIFNLVRDGLTQKQIAEKLECSEANISQQLNKITKKIEEKYGCKTDKKIDMLPETKRLQDILYFMEEIIETGKNVDFNRKLKFILETLEYKPEKFTIEQLAKNKLESRDDIIDILMWHVKPELRQYFFKSILNGIEPDQYKSRKVFYSIANSLEQYISMVKNNIDKINEYIHFKNKFLENMALQAKVG